MIRLLPMVGVLAALFVIGDTPVSLSRTSDEYFQPPPGYEIFCQSYSDLCANGRTETVQYTKELRLTLVEINSEINKFPYVYDTVRYKNKDSWQVIDKDGGDCEDYAAKKKAALIESGIPSEALRFIFLSTEVDDNIHTHVVLAVKTDKGDLILDNYNQEVYFKEQIRDYNWLLEEDTVEHWRILQQQK